MKVIQNSLGSQALRFQQASISWAFAELPWTMVVLTLHDNNRLTFRLNIFQRSWKAGRGQVTQSFFRTFVSSWPKSREKP